MEIESGYMLVDVPEEPRGIWRAGGDVYVCPLHGVRLMDHMLIAERYQTPYFRQLEEVYTPICRGAAAKISVVVYCMVSISTLTAWTGTVTSEEKIHCLGTF